MEAKELKNEKIIDLTSGSDLNSMTEAELKELRKFLFTERIKLDNEKKNQEEMFKKIQAERESFREEMRILNSKVLDERKRLKDEQIFFDKKMAILQSGFARLEMDRKEFERSKKEYNDNPYRPSSNVKMYDSFSVSNLFAGVNTSLGLKKRYKDLLKIFHPDNLNGDRDMVIAIKEEYENLIDRFNSREP